MTVHFEVVVPSYNCMNWLPTCLGSIAMQDWPDVAVTVIDDASPDPTQPTFILGFCRERGWTAWLNDDNMRMPRNLWRVLQGGGNPDDVIVLVDGDDWLPHSQVLDELAEVYTDPDVWLTWGSYTRWPDPDYMPNPALPWPPDVVAANSYRRHNSSTPFNHPLTFRRHLWERITRAELCDDDGVWFPAGYDAAIMFPMTELAGARHGRFLPRTLYVYNEGNPLSDGRTRPEACEYVHRVVRARPPRLPLP